MSNNIDDGLGIVYSDLYSFGTSNMVKSCEFVNNQGSGISIKQFGLKVAGTSRINYSAVRSAKRSRFSIRFPRVNLQVVCWLTIR